MNEREWSDRLEQAVPEVPQVFHNAMLGAFAQMAEEEQKSKMVKLPGRSLKRRTAAAILIAALLAATVAVAAALTPRVLTIFWGEQVSMREDFPEMVQYDVAEEMVGDCRVRIDEVVYDGVSLYVDYSIRNMTVEEMIGDPGEGRMLNMEEMEMLSQWEAGFWRSSLWINGQEIDMPNMSSGFMYGGDEPGEVLFSELYRLDQEGLVLSGLTRVAMPIGEKQPFEKMMEMPRAEDGTMVEPDVGCLVFYVNSDVQGVTRVENGPHSIWEDGTEVWLESAVFTPIKLYMAIGYQIPQEAIEAKLEDNRSILEWGDETMWYSVSAIDASPWVYDMMLVDGQGNAVDVRMDFADGFWSHGPVSSDYVFPYMEAYPSPLYLAPVENGVADMSRKVLVRE